MLSQLCVVDSSVNVTVLISREKQDFLNSVSNSFDTISNVLHMSSVIHDADADHVLLLDDRRIHKDDLLLVDKGYQRLIKHVQSRVTNIRVAISESKCRKFRVANDFDIFNL